jgi:hypothetical protein
LYFDTGRNFVYVNQEFIDEYKNNVNQSTKIHFSLTEGDGYFKRLTNPLYFPEGYMNFIQANGGDEMIEKLEKSSYL